MEDFIAIGKDVNAADSEGRTPLHFAAGTNNEVIAVMLIEAGANLEGVDSKNNTPLHVSSLFTWSLTSVCCPTQSFSNLGINIGNSTRPPRTKMVRVAFLPDTDFKHDGQPNFYAAVGVCCVNVNELMMQGRLTATCLVAWQV